MASLWQPAPGLSRPATGPATTTRKPTRWPATSYALAASNVGRRPTAWCLRARVRAGRSAHSCERRRPCDSWPGRRAGRCLWRHIQSGQREVTSSASVSNRRRTACVPRRTPCPGMAVIPDSFVEDVARRFALLGDPTRLKMVSVLHEDGESTVGEIAAAAGTLATNASQHLQRLTAGEILGRRRDGQPVCYQIVDDTIEQLCVIVCAASRRPDRPGQPRRGQAEKDCLQPAGGRARAAGEVSGVRRNGARGRK
jgi:DNA-binding transcriptional ArsR family regulator